MHFLTPFVYARRVKRLLLIAVIILSLYTVISLHPLGKAQAGCGSMTVSNAHVSGPHGPVVYWMQVYPSYISAATNCFSPGVQYYYAACSQDEYSSNGNTCDVAGLTRDVSLRYLDPQNLWAANWDATKWGSPQTIVVEVYSKGNNGDQDVGVIQVPLVDVPPPQVFWKEQKACVIQQGSPISVYSRGLVAGLIYSVYWTDDTNCNCGAFHIGCKKCNYDDQQAKQVTATTFTTNQGTQTTSDTNGNDLTSPRTICVESTDYILNGHDRAYDNGGSNAYPPGNCLDVSVVNASTWNGYQQKPPYTGFPACNKGTTPTPSPTPPTACETTYSGFCDANPACTDLPAGKTGAYTNAKSDYGCKPQNCCIPAKCSSTVGANCGGTTGVTCCTPGFFCANVGSGPNIQSTCQACSEEGGKCNARDATHGGGGFAPWCCTDQPLLCTPTGKSSSDPSYVDGTCKKDVCIQDGASGCVAGSTKPSEQCCPSSNPQSPGEPETCTGSGKCAMCQPGFMADGASCKTDKDCCNGLQVCGPSGTCVSQGKTITQPSIAYPSFPPVNWCPNNTCNTGIGTISATPSDFIKNLFAIVLSIAGGVAVLTFIYAGYIYMTSQGNPERLQHAQELLTAAFVGLLFTIFSLVILQTIGVDILHIPGFQ